MKINTAYSLIVLLIQMELTHSQHVKGINVTNILFQYVLICGYDYLCNETLFLEYPKPRKTNNQLNNAKLCPNCSCDPRCVVTSDCCPDLLLSNNLYPCKSASILTKFSVKKYRMVDYCPEKSDSEVKEKCERDVNDAEMLTSLPVTIPKTLMSYRNKYCANCHSDDDFIQWKLDFECKKFVDFNFLSSYQDIWEAAKNKDCEVSYVIPMDNLTITECHDPQHMAYYDQCNVTGSWKTFDPDINWMCNYDYDINYRLFKNVFCFICNPTTTQKYEIDTCNVFESKEDPDKGVSDACAAHPETQITFPFKNIFCCLCNVGYIEDVVRIDAVVSIYESMENMEFNYQVNMSSFKGDYFLNHPTNNITQPQNTPLNRIDGTPFSDVSTNFLKDMVIRNEDLVNATELVIDYLAYTSELSIAGPPIQFHQYLIFSQGCGRTESCIYAGYNDCCAELLFRYPFSCETIDDLSSLNSTQSSTYYYLTDRCWRLNVSIGLKSRCENSRHDDLLSYIPIRSSNGIHYRNWYCFICNEINFENWDVKRHSMERYEPWNIEIKCPSYLNYVYYPTLNGVIMAARNSGCDIRFKPKYDPPICDKETHLVNSCPSSWEESNSVKWACEYLKHPVFPHVDKYENMFCKICNSGIKDSVFNTCNETGMWKVYDPDIENACLNLPNVYGLYPFKNKFCALCNDDGSTMTTPIVETQTPPYPTTQTTTPDDQTPMSSEVTFRSIFSLTSYARNKNSNEANGQKCNTKTALYDAWQDECRNKTCYPGKLLINDSCIPLLHVTSNLGYILFFRLESTHVIFDIQVLWLLRIIREQLPEILQRRIKAADIDLVAFYALTHEPCDQLLRKNDISVEIYIRFYVNTEVERLRTEQLLQESKNTTFSFLFGNESLQFQSYVDLDSIYLPIKSHLVSHKECGLVENYQELALTSKQYRSVYVSNLLLCDQVELEPEEFRFDKVKMDLRLTSSDTLLTHDKFQLLPSGKARICAENYPRRIERKDSNIYALGMVTLVCTIISLCCLLVTFCTYMLFPVLRTIPGKNNVALVFAMFCSQLLLQFAVGQTGIPKLCIVLGFFVHFFWMSMFGCMCVCSCHMFRVFKGITVPTDRGHNNKIIMKYITLSYGLPAIITLTNVAAHLGLTNGTDAGYGAGKCFISGRLSFIISFLTPILLICLLNILFFVVTLYKITVLPKIQSNKQDRNDVAIYLKLFTLTGLLWLLQVIDSFFHLSVFSYIVAVLNGLQGLFIFLSYICNKRVMNLYRKKFLKTDYGAGSTTGTANNTPTRTTNTHSRYTTDDTRTTNRPSRYTSDDTRTRNEHSRYATNATLLTNVTESKL